jgi:D-proline reductase (dithiol) PrdB
VALVTTGGVHLQGQPPFDTSNPEGDPSYRELPVETPGELFCITHDYYDHVDAETDLNLVLPIQRLREFEHAGAIGRLHGTAYSLMGHVSGERLEEVAKKTAHQIAGLLAVAGIDYALLVPAGGSCNRTIGLLARAIEAAGIATIALSSARNITAETPPPRALCVRFPFGHALGEPANRNQQCMVLHEAFQVLFMAERPGTITDSPLRWRSERYFAPDWDEIKKLEPLQRPGH